MVSLKYVIEGGKERKKKEKKSLYRGWVLIDTKDKREEGRKGL